MRASLVVQENYRHFDSSSPLWPRLSRERVFIQEVNVQNCIRILLSLLAGSFFFPPISSLRAVNFGSGCSNPRIKNVAWEHEYDYSSLPITVSSVQFPGQSATLFGPSEGRNSAIVNAGVATQWTPRFSTFIGYQGLQGRTNYNSNAVTGGFSFSF
jgi:hypothetical protein